MVKPFDRPMRYDIRQAVSDYFMPVRYVAHLANRAFRALTGRPSGPGPRDGWRSA